MGTVLFELADKFCSAAYLIGENYAAEFASETVSRLGGKSCFKSGGGQGFVGVFDIRAHNAFYPHASSAVDFGNAADYPGEKLPRLVSGIKRRQNDKFVHHSAVHYVVLGNDALYDDCDLLENGVAERQTAVFIHFLHIGDSDDCGNKRLSVHFNGKSRSQNVSVVAFVKLGDRVAAFLFKLFELQFFFFRNVTAACYHAHKLSVGIVNAFRFHQYPDISRGINAGSESYAEPRLVDHTVQHIRQARDIVSMADFSSRYADPEILKFLCVGTSVAALIDVVHIKNIVFAVVFENTFVCALYRKQVTFFLRSKLVLIFNAFYAQFVKSRRKVVDLGNAGSYRFNETVVSRFFNAVGKSLDRLDYASRGDKHDGKSHKRRNCRRNDYLEIYPRGLGINTVIA